MSRSSTIMEGRFKVVLHCCWIDEFLCFMDGHFQATVVLIPCLLSRTFKEATMGITLFHLFICFLLYGVYQEGQYCMIGFCHFMAGDDSRMAGGESRMTGDCCRPQGSIHRCVCTHSHLYSYIYGLVALLDNTQLSFSSITISTYSIT
jgi:hypothetical protein